MGELWREWIQGKYLSVMSDLAIYFAKRNEPHTIFKDNFNQSRILHSSKAVNFLDDFGPVFDAMSEHILPGRKIEFIKELWSSISIFLGDERLGAAKSRLIVIEHIETLLICLSSQLNSIEFESITLSSEDEAELFSMLDLIAEVLSKLEPNFVGWFICLSAWWRIESQKRLFDQSDGQNQLFTTEINVKLENIKNRPMKNNQFDNLMMDVIIQGTHWSCITGFELSKNLERMAKFLSNLHPEIALSESNIEMICEISPDLYQTNPDVFISSVAKMLKSDQQRHLAIRLLEDNSSLYCDVLKSDFGLLKMIPASFLSQDKLQILLEDGLTDGSSDFIFQMLHSPVSAEMMDSKFGKKFYKKMSKINDDVISEDEKFIVERAVDYFAKKYPEKIEQEMEKCDADMKDHVQLAWLKVLARQIKKDEVDMKLAKNISWRILKYHRKNDQYNIVVVNAVKVFTQVEVYDNVLDRVPFEFQPNPQYFAWILTYFFFMLNFKQNYTILMLF